MWSKKPMPVSIVDAPEPSRSTRTKIDVSLVSRRISAARDAGAVMLGSVGREGYFRASAQSSPADTAKSCNEVCGLGP